MAQSSAKKLARAEAKEKRRQAQTEVTAAKFRVGIGFAATYVGTQVLLPIIMPDIAKNQALVDGAIGIGGGIVAVANSGPIGDFALGASLVGGIQTLDTIGVKIQEWRAQNP